MYSQNLSFIKKRETKRSAAIYKYVDLLLLLTIFQVRRAQVVCLQPRPNCHGRDQDGDVAQRGGALHPRLRVHPDPDLPGEVWPEAVE